MSQHKRPRPNQPDVPAQTQLPGGYQLVLKSPELQSRLGKRPRAVGARARLLLPGGRRRLAAGGGVGVAHVRVELVDALLPVPLCWPSSRTDE